MPNKTLDLVLNNPPATIFALDAQLWVAQGLYLFLVLWGVSRILFGAAKIIKAWRK